MSIELDRRSLLALIALAGGASTLAGCGVQHHDASVSADPSLVAADVARAAGDPGAVGDVAAAMSRFGGAMYGGLAAGADGNLALSPYSIMVALAMVLNGAGGATAEQLGSALGGVDTARLNGGLNALTQELEGLAGKVKRADGSSAELALAAANQLFGDASMTWAKPFLETLARDYGAGMRVVDYQRHTEQARAAINDWTATQTHDRIPEIIPAGVLDALTRLVLVNAIYLKAPWESPFLKGATQSLPFHRADGSKISVDTMAGHGEGGLVRGRLGGVGWRAARLPYAGRRLAMTVVLPDGPQVEGPGGLHELEAAIAQSGVADLLAAPGQGVVVVKVPKWKFRTASPVGPLLRTLGVADAFDPGRADFDPMTGSANDLFVSAVLHQAFIAVDEEGTEAAAATAAAMAGTSAPAHLDQLALDRPFVFVIHDVAHGTPLFVGRVADPSAA